MEKTEREKMLAGELYDCGDPELLERWHLAKELVRAYNNTASNDMEARDTILDELLGGRGKNLWITAPFYGVYRKARKGFISRRVLKPQYPPCSRMRSRAFFSMREICT